MGLLKVAITSSLMEMGFLYQKLNSLYLRIDFFRQIWLQLIKLLGAEVFKRIQCISDILILSLSGTIVALHLNNLKFRSLTQVLSEVLLILAHNDCLNVVNAFFAILLLSSFHKIHLEIPESHLSDEFPGSINNLLKN